MADGPAVARMAGVTKRYGPVTALENVGLDVRSGEVLGLLGPNAAGKTTLVSLLAGLRTPDAGSVEIFGLSPRQTEARLRLGVTPQETGMPDVLKAAELVDWAAAHFPQPLARNALLADFGLSDVAERKFGGLSGGQKRRLTVAIAFAGDPDLALLDEPTTGLDVGARRSLWQALRKRADAGKTILLTSHYLEEIEILADRVVVLAQGRIVADGSVSQVRGLVGLTRVSFQTRTATDLTALPRVSQAVESDGRVEVLSDDADAFVRALVRQDVDFRRLEVRPASLEEAFLALTDRAAASEAEKAR